MVPFREAFVVAAVALIFSIASPAIADDAAADEGTFNYLFSLVVEGWQDILNTEPVRPEPPKVADRALKPAPAPVEAPPEVAHGCDKFSCPLPLGFFDPPATGAAK